MSNEKATTQAPHQINGSAEFLLIVRWLRSIDSRMISRLRSAVMFVISSMISWVFLDVKRLVLFTHARRSSCRKVWQRHRSSGLHGKDNKVYDINQIIVQISLHGDSFFNISHPKWDNQSPNSRDFSPYMQDQEANLPRARSLLSLVSVNL